MGTGIIVLISIVVFLTIILLLVGVLLYVRAKLTPPGKVKITINDETEIEADPGSSLLSTL
jgi:Na+-transporting NADH:ubiquinone oxidoreductase subunit F